MKSNKHLNRCYQQLPAVTSSVSEVLLVLMTRLKFAPFTLVVEVDCHLEQVWCWCCVQKFSVWALYHHLVDRCGTATGSCQHAVTWIMADGDEVLEAFKEDGRCGDIQRAGSLQLLGVAMDDG